MLQTWGMVMKLPFCPSSTNTADASTQPKISATRDGSIDHSAVEAIESLDSLAYLPAVIDHH
jgi:hypothetical protein